MDTPVALRVESGLFHVFEVKFRKSCLGVCTLMHDLGVSVNVPRVGDYIEGSSFVRSVKWHFDVRHVYLFMGESFERGCDGSDWDAIEWNFQFMRMGVNDYLGWKLHSVDSWWNGVEFSEARWDETHAPFHPRACCIQNLLPPDLYAIAWQADEEAHAALLDQVEAEFDA
jgi:hypothetical protein